MNKSKAILTFSLLTMLILLIATAAFAAVEVNYFKFQSWIGNVVTVEWETGSEGDLSAFYVWRSDTNVLIDNIGPNPEEQGLVQLNPDNEPILNPEARCQPGSSRDYSYPDNTVADEQNVYYYYLQALKCNSNTREFYDEVKGAGGLEVNRPTATPTATGTVTTPTPTATATTPTSTATATPSTPSGSVLYLPIIMR